MWTLQSDRLWRAGLLGGPWRNKSSGGLTGSLFVVLARWLTMAAAAVRADKGEGGHANNLGQRVFLWLGGWWSRGWAAWMFGTQSGPEVVGMLFQLEGKTSQEISPRWCHQHPMWSFLFGSSINLVECWKNVTDKKFVMSDIYFSDTDINWYQLILIYAVVELTHDGLFALC